MTLKSIIAAATLCLIGGPALAHTHTDHDGAADRIRVSVTERLANQYVPLEKGLLIACTDE